MCNCNIYNRNSLVLVVGMVLEGVSFPLFLRCILECSESNSSIIYNKKCPYSNDTWDKPDISMKALKC